MAASLEDRVVVVIGGSSGIGLATARAAGAAGARVTIVGRDQERLDAAVADLGGATTGVSLDVADEAAVAALFEGLDHVDHVVNLAGTHVTGAIAEVDTDRLHEPVDNRFWGPIHVFKHAPPKMDGGSITICTGAGVARPRAGAAIVAAACAGSELMAQAMAIELAPIRINVIRPGIIDTPLLDRMSGGNREAVIEMLSKRTPAKRAGQPEEIAHGIEFLMTNEFVTGSVLTIDGGSSLI
jgi:NAD(P)-dependent dehydrogenase (short-subunit alcohol dehydrogenase family)